MKKLLLLTIILSALSASAQIGVKAGLNFANITTVSAIGKNSHTGFHAGVMLGLHNKKLIGFKTELIYSSQGYDYKSGSNNNAVKLEYLLLPQLLCINATKFIQIQAGGQLAYLFRASNDSSGGQQTISDYLKKLDYGITGGVEIHPVKNLLIGARVNFSLGKMYKDLPVGTPPPSFYAMEAKSNVVQIFAGLKLGK